MMWTGMCVRVRVWDRNDEGQWWKSDGEKSRQEEEEEEEGLVGVGGRARRVEWSQRPGVSDALDEVKLTKAPSFDIFIYCSRMNWY